jgi:glutamate racemase
MKEEVKQHPIGIFDSGVGGLTVLKALRQELPGRDFLYVGDTARVPYGRKPREMVEQFAWEITGFLLDQGADAVVIACNTASAASLPRLAEQMPIPVWGVVDPGVSAACKLTRTGRVGVIGTRGTIDSGAYQDRLRARGLEVWAQACPLFVHLVEEGLSDSEEAELLAHHYLDARPPIDALILGCTHYPLLENVLRRVLGDETAIVSSAQALAAMIRETLGPAPVAPGRLPGAVTHYVTGDAASYRHTAQRIGGVDGDIVKVDSLATAAALHSAI